MGETAYFQVLLLLVSLVLGMMAWLKLFFPALGLVCFLDEEVGKSDSFLVPFFWGSLGMFLQFYFASSIVLNKTSTTLEPCIYFHLFAPNSNIATYSFFLGSVQTTRQCPSHSLMLECLLHNKALPNMPVS